MIEAGDYRAARTLTAELLQEGFAAEEIAQHGLMPGMKEIGRKFASQQVFIPEMLLSARAFKMAGEEIRTQLKRASVNRPEQVVIGTVQGDLHDIGKNLVAMLIRSEGFSVIDLGVDVPPEQFVRVAEENPSVRYIALSAMLTTTLPAMRRTVDSLRNCQAASRIRILIGGAPVTAQFARAIGADIYTETAFEAAEALRNEVDQMCTSL